VAGAAAASVVGRLTDRGHGPLASTASILLLVASWTALAAGKSSVIFLIIGIVVLDLGAQGLHITNQSAIYALRPDARSRLTTAYMVSYFLGGAALSAATSSLYTSDGWSGVCVLGAITAALALVTWAITSISFRAHAGGKRTRSYDRPVSGYACGERLP
jgi:MFS family permease